MMRKSSPFLLCLLSAGAALAQQAPEGGRSAKAPEGMAGVLSQLGVQWPALLINAIGFLLLFLLLKKLFWGRVGEFLAARERRVQNQLEEADRIRASMQTQHEELQERLARIEEEARDRIQAATREAREAREQILADAREQANAHLRRAEEAIAREKDEALVELRDVTVDLAIRAAEKAVGAALDEHPERYRALVADFLRNLESTPLT